MIKERSLKIEFTLYLLDKNDLKKILENHIIKVLSRLILKQEKKKKFRSIKEASDELGICSSSICLNCKKKSKLTRSKKDGMIYIFDYI